MVDGAFLIAATELPAGLLQRTQLNIYKRAYYKGRCILTKLLNCYVYALGEMLLVCI